MHTMPTNKRRVFAYGHSVTAKFLPTEKRGHDSASDNRNALVKVFWCDA